MTESQLVCSSTRHDDGFNVTYNRDKKGVSPGNQSYCIRKREAANSAGAIIWQIVANDRVTNTTCKYSRHWFKLVDWSGIRLAAIGVIVLMNRSQLLHIKIHQAIANNLARILIHLKIWSIEIITNDGKNELQRATAHVGTSHWKSVKETSHSQFGSLAKSYRNYWPMKLIEN